MPFQPTKKSIQLQASSPTQLVEQLRSMSPELATASLSLFMLEFAKQFKERTNGLIVRTDTTDHFIADLLDHGWIITESNAQE
ncbi:hypothetical protein EQG79_29005 [Spirosoma sordidisoli]|uniref:Uncharacterized protein n=1 Tax=Spirosoma sordidisoli TaxID=2502893 RepID=A0A4Q2UC18_9BACT|nr:hypothetical protein EQG79_29005 [Spirosoma sordidisoli]